MLAQREVVTPDPNLDRVTEGREPHQFDGRAYQEAHFPAAGFRAAV
jgi:hypothetical protein